MTRMLAQVATLGPVGHLFPASGTAGSLIATLVALLLVKDGYFILLCAVFLVSVIGVFAADAYIQTTGKHDPGEVIIDEVAGQWLVFLCVPLNLEHTSTFLWYASSFILFRLFDIVKPWPVSVAERLPGGLGVMADDLVAGALAGLCVLLARVFISVL